MKPRHAAALALVGLMRLVADILIVASITLAVWFVAFLIIASLLPDRSNGFAFSIAVIPTLPVAMYLRYRSILWLNKWQNRTPRPST